MEPRRERGKGINTVRHAAMTLRRKEGKDIGDQEKKGSVDLMSTSR